MTTVHLDDSRHGMETLADSLWAERHVVELLLYKLVTAKLLLAADERRFTTLAFDEVERAVDLLRDAETRRAEAVETIADAIGVPPEALTLSELADHAPDPMGSVFRDHRDAFSKLAAEIEQTAAVNRRLATAALGQVQQALGTLTGPSVASTYTAAGRHDVSTPHPMRLDQVL